MTQSQANVRPPIPGMVGMPDLPTVHRTVRPYVPGMAIVPGSLVLTHRHDFYSSAVTFGQQLRFHGERRKYAHWSHAAIVVDGLGSIVEALGKGVELNNLVKYAGVDTRVITPWALADPATMQRVVHYAEHCLGRQYGVVEIGSLGVCLVTGGKLHFAVDNQMICSGLAASALSRTDAIFQHEPVWMMPADLGEFYDVA